MESGTDILNLSYLDLSRTSLLISNNELARDSSAPRFRCLVGWVRILKIGLLWFSQYQAAIRG